jgi:hypothetical protein
MTNIADKRWSYIRIGTKCTIGTVLDIKRRGILRQKSISFELNKRDEEWVLPK